MIKDGDAKLPGDWQFWQEHDTEMMGHCRVFLRCLFPGWEASVGLAAETIIAREKGLAIVELYNEPLSVVIGRINAALEAGK